MTNELIVARGACIVAALALVACEKDADDGGRAETTEGAEEAAASPEPAEAEAPPEERDRERVDVTDAGFETPESVLYDPEADVYLVSNIQGSPLDEDDNGFISRVSPEGEVLELKWIDGEAGDFTLNAPKGTAIAGGKLYVADIDTVRVFDRETGEHREDIPIDGAAFVNDLAAGPDGSVYASDTGVGGDFKPIEGKPAVYRIDPQGEVKRFAGGEAVGQPNGLLYDDGLWVADFGSSTVRKLDDEGEVDETWEAPEGGLDGLVATGEGVLLVSSWEGSAIYAREDGEVTERFSGLESPADIGFDAKRQRLLVPIFNGNQVTILPLQP
ncbi:MAG: SMP-30/gluconolactonase/LRE family protein [Myxococcota bacterium]